MICPACDSHHDGPKKYCTECLVDLRLMLESCEPEVCEVVAEWIKERLENAERPETVECPKCTEYFTI